MICFRNTLCAIATSIFISSGFVHGAGAKINMDETISRSNVVSTDVKSAVDTSTKDASDARENTTLVTKTEQELLEPWNEMNLQFRSAYALARSDKYSTAGPLIIQKEDKLILDYNGKREEVNVIPPKYTLLKSVAHIPLTIFVILEDAHSKPLSQAALSRLKTFRESYLKAAQNLDRWKLTDDCLDRQNLLISESSEFIDQIIKSGSISDARLMQFTRRTGALVLENAYEAISFELSAIDKQMKKWQQEIPAADWKRLHIAVMSGHMPREQNSAMMYFQRLLKEKREGQSVIYGEGKNEELYAIELVSTHMLDKEIAVYFFKDPWRMHRDLLSDGAKRYLKAHPPKIKR